MKDLTADFDMDYYGFDLPQLDFQDVPDLTEDEYDEPEHVMLKCPSCGHIDRKEHFMKAD